MASGVFEAFVRGDASRGSDGGTIAKKVMEWHNGDISLESTPGKTLFRIKLPKSAAGKS
jgi:signal transduction histidine kinase